MTDTTPKSRPEKSALKGTWHLSALLIFAIIATLEWALAAASSTGLSLLGLSAGWLVFVSLWLLGATLWAVASGAVLWAMTGNPSAVPFIERLVDMARRCWSQRHDEVDSQRLAIFVASTLCLFAFLAASLGLTAHLIATRNGPWIIAGTSLLLQTILAICSIIFAVILTRAFRIALLRIRKDGRLSWLHTPLVAAISALAVLMGALAGLVLFFDVFLAMEGPSFALVASAILLHPLAAFLVQRRLKTPPAAIGRALWATPIVALLLIGAFTQNSDARRLLILHGEASHFAYHHLQHHIGFDRIFRRGDCPPIGLDGLPVDGTSWEEYEARCLDIIYDRPFSRAEVPDFQGPDSDLPPNFLFITWDSVRVDRLGFMGHDRDTTPFLDDFSSRSLVFDRAFAQDSGTGPSFWSLMAGKTPFQVAFTSADRFPPAIAPEEQMLGELLEQAGYRNEAIMCGSVFERENWAIKNGFTRFENVCGRRRNFLAPTVAAESVRALERLTNGDDPFFLWVHFFDPHHPYTDHPEIGFGESRLDRYDEELRYTDAYTRQLIEAALELQSDRPLYIIFSADHGENFGEHGSDPHARNLYRNVTHVPKLVYGPGIEPRRIDAPVALNDVYPSVLDLAGIDVPRETTMVSQVPVFFGADPDEERMVFQENSYSRPRRHTRAVVYGRFHYIMDLTTNSDEFYDYVADPLERNNLIGTGLTEELILRQALIRFLQTSTIPDELRD